MGKQSLFKKNVLDIKDNKSWLHNVYVLYFIFIIAFGDLYYLMVSHSWFYMMLFILVGFLTSFFSKNMVVILCIAVVFTNILKTALTGMKEGFEESPSATTPSATPKPTAGKQAFTIASGDSKKPSATTSAPSATTSAPSATTSVPSATTSAPSATTDKKTKEPTDQSADGFTDGVYTTEQDMEYKKAYDQKEIITNQAKIMKNLNKYKPLLETINSITKNIAVFKS